MATNKPSSPFIWDTTGTNRQDPGPVKRALGWIVDERPASSIFNWIQNYLTSFIASINDHGVAPWDNSSSYANGALSWHGGIIYARTSAGNGGAAPGTANAPWIVFAVTPLTGNVNVSIPTDFATLQEAFDAYRNQPSNGFIVTLNIESGHSPSSGLNVRDGDYGHFRIVSVDNQVTVSGSSPDDADFISGTKATLPELHTLINMSGRGRHGASLDRSVLFVQPNHGIINAGDEALRATRGSFINAFECLFSGAASYGLRSFDTSRANVALSDFSDAGNVGIEANSASTITAQGCNVTGATNVGVQSSGSKVIAANVDASGAGTVSFAVINGGVMTTAGTTGDKNIAVNTPTAQGLILG